MSWHDSAECGPSEDTSGMDTSGPLGDSPLKGKGQLPDGPFHLRHATHTRVVKGEVGCPCSRVLAFRVMEPFTCAQDIMSIEALPDQVRAWGHLG